VTALVWFTRDLRVHDHPPLRGALEEHDRVVPVFCFDDRLLHGRHASGPRTQFMLESLRDLDTALRERGSGLVLRHGPPEDELSDLAQLVGASEVLYSANSSPYARARARHVRAGLARAGAGLRTEPGLHAVDDLSTLRTQAGKPYVVFSPFHRAWLQQPRRDVLPAPRSLPPLPAGVRRGRMPSLHALGLASEAADAPAGGEAEARRRARAFLAGPVRRYPEESSRLSPYLHFGCISARELEERQTADEFRRQLAWRDFYHHVLLHHPGNARRAHQPRYRGLRWSRSRERFDAWCAGRTGFPLVDAGMRQLRREGWMPNRVRLVVGSFLTKDLWIDWRWGERWFMRHLVDGDEANNNGNWQWIASVGTDPQPPFRRIYNPARHQERLDPDGVYVRRWVSELERVPGHALAEPWRLSEDEQRTSGCMIGRDYPEPIVDHAAARREALARYAAAS
jgi:deoxyribodipyrimidine photo-lyase